MFDLLIDKDYIIKAENCYEEESSEENLFKLASKKQKVSEE